MAKGRMGLRQYARYRGVSLSSVQRAIRAGYLVVVGCENSRVLLSVGDSDRNWIPKQTVRINGRDSARNRESAGDLERARLQLLVLRYYQLTGQLVPTSQVEAEAFSRGRTIRDNLLNIPGRICHELAASNSPSHCKSILEREISHALDAALSTATVTLP